MTHIDPIETPDNDTPDLAGGTADGASLAAQLEAVRAELAQVREESLRERAELDNQRKRMARDIDMARKFANERVLGDLLPVIDSLEAGLTIQADTAQHLREGMELTLRQLLKVVTDNGLVAIDPAGKSFNPEQHQAMSMVESAGHAPGDVVQVYQKGWLLNERLLRPALVVVAKHD
ncbi:nucleotide exchange factor GrpE [Lysobacter sp. TAF61]|uniref:nucleotide exchange factor GrpE n=1 Tax=Lysobacter sp. TAF61 TaxID=3233072 RepID=UPI003F951F57